jgi:hypothetical protein
MSDFVISRSPRTISRLMGNCRGLDTLPASRPLRKQLVPRCGSLPTLSGVCPLWFEALCLPRPSSCALLWSRRPYLATTRGTVIEASIRNST